MTAILRDGETIRGELTSKEGEAGAAAGQAGALAAELEALRQQERLDSASAAEARALLSALAAAAQELLDRESTLRRALSEEEESLGGLEQEAQENGAALKRDRADRDALENIIQGHVLRVEAREKKAAAARERERALELEDHTLRSRIHMLTELERSYEGYSRAVKLVMGEAERGRLKGVRGPVASLIRVPAPYAVAIETALGGAMQHLVVEREEHGKAAIQWLKRREGGRATFLPMDTIRPVPFRESGVEQSPGFVGMGDALVECEAAYGKICANLLGRTVIAEDLDAAVAIAGAYGHRFKIVTLDGQVLNPGGSMTGGSVSRSAGILSRSNELQQLSARGAGTRRRPGRGQGAAVRGPSGRPPPGAMNWRAPGGSCAGTRTASSSWRSGRSARKNAWVSCTPAWTSERKNWPSCSGGRNRPRRTPPRPAHASRRWRVRPRPCAPRRPEKRRDRPPSGSGRRRSARRWTPSTGAWPDWRLSGRPPRAASGSWRPCGRSWPETGSSRPSACGNMPDRTRPWRPRSGEKEAALQTIREEKEAAEADILRLNQEKLELEARRNRADRDSREKNAQLLQLERTAAGLEQKKQAHAMEEKGLLDKLWESYELTHQAALQQRVPLESTAQAQRRVAELKRGIAGLGNINLDAIEEFERVNERYTYLTEQRDDVEKAKADLAGIIAGITAEMKRLFGEQFVLLNEAFQTTFRELFGGGQAALELEDASDILNCGIEIRVQPPGKALKVLSLLSGGEKAFVAIALYFAILKVRPTPFCVMDEIEAALDDANVTRFARYLRSVSNKTQFIVITHRRGTMEEADVLYGVTMQERGVSRMLTINLNDVERELGIE